MYRRLLVPLDGSCLAETVLVVARLAAIYRATVVRGDVGASAGVIAGGLIILLTRWYPADPLISLVIALLITRVVWDVLRETVNILMEATPADVNVARLARDIIRLPGIADVHDLHIWSIAGGMRALSAHGQVDDRPLSVCDPLLGQINGLLQDRYKISHTTIQFECTCSAPDDLYCRLNGTAEHGHDHRHERTTDGMDVRASA